MEAKIFIGAAILLFIYMTIWFAVGRSRQRIDTVDVAWGLGFVLIAWWAVLQHATTHGLVIAVLVTVWGVRLSTHIFRRSLTKPDDPRYQELRGKWKGNVWRRAYVSIFLLQGALVWLVGLPIMTAAGASMAGRGWLTFLGVGLWLAGFVLEAVADRQLARFLSQKNHPSVLRTGLWRFSRHPNYFGELVQWWGIALIALQVKHGWIGLIGPIVLSILIIFVSGIPPIERRRRKNLEYQEYKRCTSVLVPLPPRK